MKTRLLLVVMAIMTATTSIAQVGISNDNSAPDPSAMLDVKSATGGILVPRMVSVERLAISAAATGLLVYQTDAPAGFYFYDGTGWNYLGTPEGGVGQMIDADGNSYPTVMIGGEVWMQENLQVTHYRNGDAIDLVTDNSAWSRPSGAYCWYNHDTVINAKRYGALYNWGAVNDSRGLCPAGWHVATHAEWTALTTYLGGTAVAGGKLKSALLFLPPNVGATNASGFSARPGGFRVWDGVFSGITERSYWWTSTPDGFNAWYRTLGYSDTQVEVYSIGGDFGFSVRCVRD
jgi:uncharacterized protein (TIGR02145 family)